MIADKYKFRHAAMVGLVVTGFLSIPYQIIERGYLHHVATAVAQIIDAKPVKWTILPAPAQRSVQPSPYLVAPGNRTPCSQWIGKQSDSSLAPFRVSCTTRSRT